MTTETITLTRAEIARLRDARRIERGHVHIRLAAGGAVVDRYDVLLDMAEAHLDETARLADALGSIAILTDQLNKAHRRLGELSDPAPTIAAARAEGVREGIEMAAQYIHDWDPEKLGRPGMYASVDLAEAFDTGAIDASISIEHGVRALSPPPAEPSAPVAPEDDTRCERAKALAEVYGIALQDVRSTVGAPEDANNWRQFLALADDGWTPLTLRAKAALEAENAALRRELEPLAREAERYDPPAGDSSEDLLEAWDSRFTIGHLRRARALLQGQGGNEFYKCMSSLKEKEIEEDR